MNNLGNIEPGGREMFSKCYFWISSSWQAVGPVGKEDQWEGEELHPACFAGLYWQCPYLRNDGQVFISASESTQLCLRGKDIRVFRGLRIMPGKSDGPGRQQLLSLETNSMDKTYRRAGHASTPPVFSSISTVVCMSPGNDRMYNDSMLRLRLIQVNCVNVERSPEHIFL